MSTAEQMDFVSGGGVQAPVKDAAGLVEALPGLVEYEHGGQVWRCNRFDLLAAGV